MAQIPHNVVFIGETGSGKSSMINLIANHNHAVVTSNVAPCTTAFVSYDVSIQGKPYRLWDTPGLNRASGLNLFRRKNTVAGSLKRFLQERRRRGELDLLVLCVQGGRAHEAMMKAYKTFCRATRRIAIPVVIAITHLERVQPTMETWWQDNERKLGDLGWASQQDIRVLISAEYQRRPLSTSSDREYLNDPNNGCVVC